MFSFKVRYCKARMTAFINGELSPKARNRVARLIDECPECYEEYRRARQLQGDLRQQLRRFGQPTSAQLEGVWRNIQAEMDGKPKAPIRTAHSWRYRASTSAAIIVLLASILLPFMMNSGQTSRASITPPVPPSRIIATTESPTSQVVAAATLTAAQTDAVQATRLQPHIALPVTPAQTPEATRRDD
ncbi:MAG: hypothetical protein SF029_18685 [bacterium]|nr:hypothetical protein [bacterium]